MTYRTRNDRRRAHKRDERAKRIAVEFPGVLAREREKGREIGYVEGSKRGVAAAQWAEKSLARVRAAEFRPGDVELSDAVSPMGLVTTTIGERPIARWLEVLGERGHVTRLRRTQMVLDLGPPESGGPMHRVRWFTWTCPEQEGELGRLAQQIAEHQEGIDRLLRHYDSCFCVGRPSWVGV